MLRTRKKTNRKKWGLFFLISLGTLQSTYCQEHMVFHVSNDLSIIKLSEHAYVHVSYATLPGVGRFPSNGLVYINQGKGFLFDTPMTDSLTRKLVTWVRDSLKTEIVGFIPNHWHDDCMGGLGYLQRIGIDSYANKMTIDIARTKGLPVPEYGFNDSLSLNLNGAEIKCYYLGAAHTPDNIVVWIPTGRILFAGCMCRAAESKGLGNTADASIAAWPITIERVIHKFPSAAIVIPGHGRIGGLELLQHTKDLLTTR